MATKLTNYRVFIASPGGLEQERQAFRDVITVYNDGDAIARSAYFSPIGWEITLRGVGRAQEKINEEVRKCDYFILLLWDRWGTPTGSEKNFTSGTEEEYATAWECYEDPHKPMREIIVLFKAVDPRHLSDPGPQLQKVLEFKKKLENDKKLFFDTFDDLASFADKLRRYLAQWVRDHEGGNTAKVLQRPLAGAPQSTTERYLEPLEARLDLEPTDESDFVREAAQLLKDGKLTEAEAKLVQAIVPGDDLNAFRVYGQFLLNSKRYKDAEALFRRMLKLAQDSGHLSWAGFALAKLGGVFRFRKDLPRAERALKDALELKEGCGDNFGVAYVSAWLGDLYLQWGKWPQAEQAFRVCLKVNEAMNEQKFVADTEVKLAKAVHQQGKTKQALEFSDKADAIYGRLGEKKSRKKLRAWMDSVIAKEKKTKDRDSSSASQGDTADTQSSEFEPSADSPPAPLS